MLLKQKIVYIGIAIAAALGIFLFGLSLGLQPQTYYESTLTGVTKSTIRPITVLLDDGAKIASYKTKATAGQIDVLQALKQVTSDNDLKLDYDSSSPMGSFVKQIGERVNGQGKKYWQYWVNGAQPMIAADKFILRGGETVLWTFRESAL